MKHETKLGYLMRLSWEVQRRKNISRAKALQAAWAIANNADITVHYLVKKYSHKHHPNRDTSRNLTLFAAQ